VIPLYKLAGYNLEGVKESLFQQRKLRATKHAAFYMSVENAVFTLSTEKTR
jgi:hypothetical protein